MWRAGKEGDQWACKDREFQGGEHQHNSTEAEACLQWSMEARATGVEETKGRGT